MGKAHPEIRIGGHRGNGETDAPRLRPSDYMHEWPENTLESVIKALKNKATLIEVDAVLSKDGVPMVIHSNDLRLHVLNDSTFTRQLESKPYASQWTADELKQMIVGPAEAEDTFIPTLEEIMAAIADHNKRAKPPVILNIELKDTQGTMDPRAKQSPTLVEAVKTVVDKGILPPENLIFSSFATSLLQEAKFEIPEVKRGMLLTSLVDTDLGKRVFPADLEDGSRYQGFNAKQLKDIHKVLELSAIHPEISSLAKVRDVPSQRKLAAKEAKEVLNQMDKKWRSPSGEKLALNCWFLNEGWGEDKSFLVFNAIDRSRKRDLPLGLITNDIAHVKAWVEEVYPMLPQLSEDEHRKAPPGLFDSKDRSR